MAGELVARTAEAFYSGAWHDISADALNRDPVSITRGIANEGGSADPGSLNLSLFNATSRVNTAVSGRYSPRNPLSDLHGLIGPNTPIRLNTGTPPVADAFDRTVANGWGTADTGQDWTAVGGDAADYAVSGGEATIDIDTVNSNRQVWLDVDYADVRAAATFAPGVVATGDPGSDILTALVLRRQDATEMLRFELIWDTTGIVTPRIVHSDSGGATVLAFDVGTRAYTASSAWRVEAEVAGREYRMRCFDVADPAGPRTPWDIIHHDADDLLPDSGAIGVRAILVTGNTNTLPVTVTVSDAVVPADCRATAEVVAWPPRWDVSERDQWVPVEAAGPLRRLGVPESPLSPALVRATPEEPAVLAYWPLSGLGQSVRAAPSGLGGSDMRVRQINAVTPLEHAVQWSADTTGPGLGALPSVVTTQAGVGLSARVPSTTTQYGWGFWGRGDVDAALDASATMWIDCADDISWVIWVQWSGPDAATPQVLVIVEQRVAGSLQVSLTNSTTIPYTDRPTSVMAVVQQVASNVEVTVLVDGTTVAMTTSTGSLSGLDVGTTRGTRLTASLLDGRSMAVGHPTVFQGNSVGTMTTASQRLYLAGRGYVGEPAGRRAQRLCDENGVSFQSTGDLDLTGMMGAQQPGKLLELLGECAKVEAGQSRAPVLFEQRNGIGLHFRTLTSLYLPRTADLTLDYTQGQLSPPLDPTPDDFGLANDVTARRVDGGEHRTVVTAGPRGTVAAGRYDRAEDFRLASDGQLPWLSPWWAWHGTWDEDRFPLIRINMRSLDTRTNGAALVAAVKALDPGALVAITNTPAWLAAEDIEQIVLGITETISTEEWLVDLHTTAARPFLVAVIGDSTYGLTGTDSATLGEALDTTETGVDIVVGGEPDWVHEGTDYDIQVGGERMTVTAVGSATGTYPARTQTLTVTRSVNGIVKAHPSGAEVRMWHQTVIGLWG